MRIVLGLVVLSLGVLGATPMARAHPLRFGALTVTEHAGGAVTARLRFSGSERRPDAADIVLPSACVDRTPPSVSPIPWGVERVRRVRCAEGAIAAGPIGVRGIGERSGDDVAQVALRLSLASGDEISAMLDATAPEWRSVGPDVRGVAWGYGALGVEHILLGFDHLLFLAVLLLLVRDRRKLLVAITAFTIGHSLTLALAVLDVVRVPGTAIEAAIALSIAILAAEVVRDRPPPRSVALMPAIFGLVHGLGFASSLREIGLPRHDVAAALVSFNVGVELGQLVFVAAALALVRAHRRFARPAVVSRAGWWLAYGAGVAAMALCMSRL